MKIGTLCTAVRHSIYFSCFLKSILKMNTSKSRLKRQKRDRVTNHGCFIKKTNNKHSLFSSYLIDKCVIMKKEYYKNMSNKEKTKQNNITSII